MADENYYFIDTELVANEAINLYDVKCPICHGVFQEPISCENCLNHFCYRCHTQSPLHKCPLCNQKGSTRRAVPLLKNILSSLRLRCFNHQRGCTEVVEYDAYNSHLNDCPFAQKHCGLRYLNKQKCNEIVLRKDLQHHQTKECPFRPCACPHCLNMFPFLDLSEHAFKCEEASIQCEKCQHSIKKKEMKQHLLHCLQNFQQCYHCKGYFLLKDLHLHEAECPARKVCCLGCTQVFPLQEYYRHQTNCDQFPMICPHCHSKMTRAQFFHHSYHQCISALRNNFDQQLHLLNQKHLQMEQTVANCKFNQPGHRFSSKFRDPDIFVNPQKEIAVVRDQTKKRKDRFALFQRPVTPNDSWKLQLNLQYCQEQYLGITDLSSLYQSKKYQEVGHGSYLLSANGVSYSHHLPEANWKQTDFRIDQGDVIEVRLDSQAKLLVISNHTKGLTEELEVQIEGRQFYGCVCLRTAGDQIKILNEP